MTVCCVEPTSPAGAPSETLLLSSRERLQAILGRYVTNTLKHINTMKSFSDRISRWVLGREMEIEMMLDIKERAEKKKEKLAVLEEELAATLKATLNGMQELDEFLDGLEKLAFTSLHVFRENNNMLHLPPGISLDLVEDVLAAARRTCPLRLVFMMNIDDFFVPQLQNLDVLLIQLNKYVIISQLMCDKMENR